MLRERGLTYPEILEAGHNWQAERGLAAGNGEPIALGSCTITEAVRSALEGAQDAPVVLISSELLSGNAAGSGFWHELATVASDAGVEVEVVYYVRDPMGLLLSSYSQRIKGHGFTGSLSDFVFASSADPWPLHQLFHTHDILRLSALFPTVQLRLVHFDAVKHELAQHFFDHICRIPVQAAEFGDARVVNTALSPVQIAFMRGVNSIDPDVGKHLGWEYTDALRPKLRTRSNEQLSMNAAALDHFTSIVNNFREQCLLASPDFPAMNYDLTSPRVAIRDAEPDVQIDIMALGESVTLALGSGYLRWREERMLEQLSEDGK